MLLHTVKKIIKKINIQINKNGELHVITIEFNCNNVALDTNHIQRFMTYYL